MKKFMFIHVGFEKPTPELMAAWHAWFGSIATRQLAQGGFSAGIEISKTGKRTLPWNLESLTGYNIVEAESFEAAEQMAIGTPFISSIRIYELR